MFDNIIGNEKIKQNLIKSLKNDTVTHSYMFIGTSGIGKYLFAKEFAKGILCKSGEGRICNNCKSCLQLDNNNNPDYYEIKLNDDENSIKIETIRNMKKHLQELPIVSNKKVYIIDDSEYMTKEAQNCLLKTLEEPPEFAVIILIVSNESNILNTIKSRCLKIYFNNIDDIELEKYIKQNYGNVTLNMLKACNGSIGKVNSIYKNSEFYSKIDNIFGNIEQYSITDAIYKLDILYNSKDSIFEILEYLNTLFIEKSKYNYKYIDYIQNVEEIKNNIRQNCNYEMCIDRLLFNIWKK